MSPTESPSQIKNQEMNLQTINAAWKEPQVSVGEISRPLFALNMSFSKPFEVLRAVERKDVVYLMEVRDRAFHVRYFHTAILLAHTNFSFFSYFCASRAMLLRYYMLCGLGSHIEMLQSFCWVPFLVTSIIWMTRSYTNLEQGLY